MPDPRHRAKLNASDWLIDLVQHSIYRKSGQKNFELICKWADEKPEQEYLVYAAFALGRANDGDDLIFYPLQYEDGEQISRSDLRDVLIYVRG